MQTGLEVNTFDNLSVERVRLGLSFLCENLKRLVHITGVNPQAIKIKRIEIAKDPCSVKISQKEKDKVLSTSKAQSMMSSRRASMDVSRASVV